MREPRTKNQRKLIEEARKVVRDSWVQSIVPYVDQMSKLNSLLPNKIRYVLDTEGAEDPSIHRKDIDVCMDIIYKDETTKISNHYLTSSDECLLIILREIRKTQASCIVHIMDCRWKCRINISSYLFIEGNPVSYMDVGEKRERLLCYEDAIRRALGNTESMKVE